jgi:hypothetical protein
MSFQALELLRAGRAILKDPFHGLVALVGVFP